MSSEIMIKHLRVTILPKNGSGAYGAVYKAENTNTKDKVAVKQIELEQNASSNDETTEEIEEIRMVMGLQSHKNIVRVIESFVYKNSFWIVMEVCDLGDLKKYLNDHNLISRYHKVEIMLQSSSAVAFIHAQNPPVVHRDIKLLNILMKTEGPRKIAKLCDFGFARYHENKPGTSFSKVFKQKSQMQSLYGTPDFMAPELKSEQGYDRHVDTFALGLVFQVIMEPEKPNLRPRSVGMKKANKWESIGSEMVQCFKEKKGMPLVVETKRNDDRVAKKLKRIITNMTKFKSDERKRIHEVEEELEEIFNLLKDDTCTDPCEDACAKDKDFRNPFPRVESPLVVMVKHLKVTIRPHIGVGAFATIYKADDTKKKNTVAVKETKMDLRRKYQIMARHEIQVIQQLQRHENIIRAIEGFYHDNSFWLVMEFCDLGDLHTYLTENKEICRYHQIEIMRQTSSAVAFMHAQNPLLIHRDIKPQNIFIKTEGQKKIVKICNFEAPVFSVLEYPFGLKMDDLRGSPIYMAPEFTLELETGLSFDHHVDTFSLGLVFQVILEPNWPDLYPRSVVSRKAKREVNIGYEMVHCYRNKLAMPLVVETQRSDDRVTRRLKRIITQMTKF